MDREALRNQAAARRNQTVEAEAPLQRKVKWGCTFCNHDFVSERTFMNHRCREREKLDELRSPIGQAAYAYYSEWMRLNRRSVPPIETFSASSYFSTFIKFANHVLRVNMPTPMAFVKAMVDNGNVQPSLWCRDNVYALYLQGYDKVVPPTKQFIDSIDLVTELSQSHEVPLRDVFTAVGVNKVLDLVQRRKLSAWFLVASTAFREWLKNQTPDDSLRLEDAVQVGAMISRINQSEKTRDMFTDFCKATKELGL
jgi:hypothetical protein